MPDIANLGEDLAELLVGVWLAKRFPVARNLAYLLGVLRPAWEQPVPFSGARDGKVVRDPFRIDRFNGGRIVELVKDPLGALRADYANVLTTEADAAAIADKLFPRLQLLLSSLGVTSRYGVDPLDVAELGPWAAPMAHTLVIFVDRVRRQGRRRRCSARRRRARATRPVVSPFGPHHPKGRPLGAGDEGDGRHGRRACRHGQLPATPGESAGRHCHPPRPVGTSPGAGAPKSTRLEIGGCVSAPRHGCRRRRRPRAAADVTVAPGDRPGDGDG